MRPRASRMAWIVSKWNLPDRLGAHHCIRNSHGSEHSRAGDCPRGRPSRDGSLPAAGQAEGARMKRKRGRKMFREVRPVVSAGIQMEFVRNFLRREQVMKCPRARVEAELVFGSAVEVDFHSRGPRAFCHQRERIIVVPEGAIERGAEGRAHGPGERLSLRTIGGSSLRQFRYERGAVCAGRPEKLRIPQGEPQGSIAAHRDARYAAVAPLGLNAIMAFYKRQKLADEKILVTHFAVARIDVKAAVRAGSDDQEFPDLLLLPQILD